MKSTVRQKSTYRGNISKLGADISRVNCNPDGLVRLHVHAILKKDQSINQSSNQVINQPITQSINRSIKQSIKKSINQVINQSLNQAITQSIN